MQARSFAITLALFLSTSLAWSQKSSPREAAAPVKTSGPLPPSSMPSGEKPAAPEPPPAERAAGESSSNNSAQPDALGNAASEEEEEDFLYEATAEVEAPPREATRRELDAEQLTRIPGTRGDALRAIEVMPGVSRTPYGENPGPPLLRGSSSFESLVLLDGAQVPLLYHFGGLTSFFNSHLIETVSLYPGNFSARYGRATGGVVEARVRDPRSDNWHGMVELSAVDSFALAEGPLSQSRKSSLALAARRSNVDLFIDGVLPSDTATVVAAPVYWDYQAIFSHKWSEQHQLRILAYGSRDQLELILSDDAVSDPGLYGSVAQREEFHRLQLELDNQISSDVEHQFMLSVGPNPGRGAAGAVEFDYSSLNVNSRSEWSVFATDWLRVDSGFDFLLEAFEADYVGPAPPPSEGSPPAGSLAGEDTVVVQSREAPWQLGVYSEASVTPTAHWTLVPGIRADFHSYSEEWTVDPRLSTRLQMGKGWTTKAGLGLYSQFPQYQEVVEPFGNSELKSRRTVQSSLGFEKEWGESLRLDMEGYYKSWFRRVLGTEGGVDPRYENGGSGHSYGLETFVSARLSERSNGVLSYTLSRSMRKDGDAEPWRFFDYDQTHNLSVAGNYDLGRNWTFGLRFRLVTGTPTTPIDSTVYDARSDTYRPLYGEINSERLATFHQLDARIEKNWQFGLFGLTAYLEVLNLYNAKNENGRLYSFDYTESTKVLGVPFFPNLGIRGEL